MKKFENFCRALNNLEESNKYPPYDPVVSTGLVSLYQICFEQTWKAMKEAMEAEGVNTAATGSPRAIIKEAYGLQMINDEKGWLDALLACNQASHAYNQDIALEIIEHTQKIYLPLFRALKTSIETNWSNTEC